MNSDSEDETPINMDLSHLPNIENLIDERNDANAYGFENTSYITASDMDKILDSVKSYDDACATPGELVKLIHFNVDHPENRNLVMNDDKDTCIFDGKPEYNNGPMHVNYSGGYMGKFGNFRYISTSLQPDEIKLLYNLGSPDSLKSLSFISFPKFSFDYFKFGNCSNN